MGFWCLILRHTPLFFTEKSWKNPYTKCMIEHWTRGQIKVSFVVWILEIPFCYTWIGWGLRYLISSRPGQTRWWFSNIYIYICFFCHPCICGNDPIRHLNQVANQQKLAKQSEISPLFSMCVNCYLHNLHIWISYGIHGTVTMSPSCV